MGGGGGIGGQFSREVGGRGLEANTTENGGGGKRAECKGEGERKREKERGMSYSRVILNFILIVLIYFICHLSFGFCCLFCSIFYLFFPFLPFSVFYVLLILFF